MQTSFYFYQNISLLEHLGVILYQKVSIIITNIIIDTFKADSRVNYKYSAFL